MKAATERIILRWVHLVLSIPLIGFIYGPLPNIPNATAAVRYVFMPIVVLSGLWMWKGHLWRKWRKKRNSSPIAGMKPSDWKK